MLRTATVSLLFLVVTAVDRAEADGHHKAWHRYLKGEWTYEINPGNYTGTAIWRTVAKGDVLIGRFTSPDGLTGHEISGWRADSKTMSVFGYGSNGNYWQIELKTITDDMTSGPNHGILPDGRTFEGTFTGKKIDDDHYEWRFAGKTGDGEDFEAIGKYKRKSK